MVSRPRTADTQSSRVGTVPPDQAAGARIGRLELGSHVAVRPNGTISESATRTRGRSEPVTLTVLFTLMFGFMFGGAIAGSSASYLPTLIPGIIAMTAITASVAAGVNFREDMEKGVFDRFRSLPIARIAPLAGLMIPLAVRSYSKRV